MPLENDPVTLALVDGDLSFVGGRMLLASGLDAVVIGAETRLRLVYGEWALNRNVGVKWLENDLVPADQAILGSKFNAARLRAECRKAILATPGVVEILQMTIEFDGVTRTATVSWRARCEFGDTDLVSTELTA